MLDKMLFPYWWVVLAMFVAAAVCAAKIWAKRRFESIVDDVLHEAQSGFAEGSVELHSVTAVRTIEVQDETAILYHIDATITPSGESVEWCGADLYLRGTDGNPNQIGEVLHLKQWNGTSFQPIKNRALLVGTQRLLLAIRFAGSPGSVRFNFNFANFGEVIDLPEIAVSV